jgi:hypothetical protein
LSNRSNWGPITLNKSPACRPHPSLVVGILVTLASIPAPGQETRSSQVRFPTSQVEQAIGAPNFRGSDWLDMDSASPDAAPDADPRPGLVQRSIIRIGQDQKLLFKGPFEAHNLKWDAVILVGTGAFLAADRHIENNIPHSNFTAYQAISDTALGGLAASLAGVYLYGAKTEDRHARETGELELETLVNTFLIYTPMQLIAGRQRPDEGNNHGDFFKHHALNTSFPGGHAMFTWAMASVLADEYPRRWARVLSYGAAFTVTFTRFMARDHWSSDMFLGTGLGLAIAERTFHARCNPEFESQCKRHQWWWKPMKMEVQ